MTRTKEWLYGWLLLLPAMTLLVLFTHYPAVANLWHSFYSTPRGNRSAVFVGLDNYRQLADDPKFDTSNYHGVAERYWGLIRADGSNKPALDAFIEGVRADRGNASATLTAPQ